MKLDNLHYNFSKIDGYDKAFNFVISEREAGKSTATWIKVYNRFKKLKRPSIVLRRLINDISEAYIMDISEVINKFQPEDEQIVFKFKKGSIKEGVVDVYIDDILFIRLIALSNPISRIKSLIVRNLMYIIFDEFICNTRLGEKYIQDEAFKFKEIYNTFQRETENLKCYFLGNPYSLYNPYFVWVGVDTGMLKRGTIVTGDAWAIECYQITDELRAAILAKNPLYTFDDSYTKYAFEGQAINDMNIIIDAKQPQNYRLKHVFHMNGKYIGFFQGKDYSGDKPIFWASVIEYTGDRRKIYCFEFKDLVNKTILMSREDTTSFYYLKQCIRSRNVSYSSLEVAYMAEEIYTQS